MRTDPLEQLKNASFVFASPGFSFRSTKCASFKSPSLIKPSSVESDGLGGESIRMTLLSGIPAARAAERAVWREPDSVTMREDFVISIWYNSSSELKDGLAGLGHSDY